MLQPTRNLWLFFHPNSIDINYGGSAKFDDLKKISMVPAHHTSSFPDGTYGGQPLRLYV